ncbi:hypothetical protein Nepgr_012367 [Nepenthes gracilis]|uniref:RING-type E3 ubiquitin transferase BRCA1 n=1 Tax=Nepenthes gracilis TaxID=150966 RepID=A0AAD3SHE1_NEPGR|nr:hypothetical protein Nepgr_012367 [Nepenthes gracilis]
MESIVATVSGYHGSERFKLIKLISLAGASYVGAMTRSTTHLICWKFGGKKYDLAKKLRIVIVNHLWLEECIKVGKHIPEHAFTMQSGHEVGSVTLDAPTVARITGSLIENRLLLDKSNVHDGSRYPVIDVELEEIEPEYSHDNLFFYENLLSQPGKSNNASAWSKEKAVKKFLKKDRGANSRQKISQSQKFSLERLEYDESSCYTSKSRMKMRERKSITSAELSHRSRRLVKKNAKQYLFESSFSVGEHEGCALGTELWNNVPSTSDFLNNLHYDSEENIGSRSKDAYTDLSGTRNEDLTEVEEINGINDGGAREDSCLQIEAPAAMGKTLRETSSDIDKINGKLKTGDQVEQATRFSTSIISCAICWTDFSSTRGVLPCGHRFCFSCIQRWADCMALDGKNSTCPMCNANFACITKVDDASCLEQKMYSQTVPSPSSTENIFIVHDGGSHQSGIQMSLESICCQCHSREPEDLLIPCHQCRIRCVHSYCLDPPLFPWICISCRDLRVFY